MKVHYPKLYSMAHLSLNVFTFTASKGSKNYILFSSYGQCIFGKVCGFYAMCTEQKRELLV